MNSKIAFISSYMGPYYSNYVAATVELEVELQRNGYESVYIFPKAVEHYEWVDALRKVTDKIYFIDYAPKSLGNFRELRSIFKKEKVNLIYSRYCGWDFTAHFCALHLPIVWHMDMNVNIIDKVKRLKNLAKFHILAIGKTYHVAVSEPVGAAINALKPRHRCEVIPNALDFSRLHESKRRTESDSVKNVLLFGYDPYVKGLDLALNACTELNCNGIQYRLLVSAQKRTYSYMNERYPDGIPEWVELLPPTDTVSDLYDRADIMLSASRSESFSFCLGEAIWSGVKPVYSDIPGTNWADEFRGGVTFQSGNVQSLVSALQNATTKISAEELNRNRALMLEKYSLNAWSKKIIQLIQTIS